MSPGTAHETTGQPHRTHEARAQADRRAGLLWALWGVGVLGGASLLGSIGRDAPAPIDAGAIVFDRLRVAGWPVLIWCVAAMGLGRLGSRLWRGARTPLTIQGGFGVALLLTFGLALGIAGALRPWSAVALLAVGCALAGGQLISAVRRGRVVPRAPSLTAIAWGGALAVLLTAGSQPTGALWASEFGVYDSLSYHLQLPQEWQRDGAVRTYEHNVYSFLPGAIESAYLLLMHATSAPIDGADGHGLLAGDGWRVFMPHWLSVALTLLAGAGVRAAVLIFVGENEGRAPDATRRAATLGGVGVMLTPWVLVVGTISYNDVGVVALGACALAAGATKSMDAIPRAVVCAVLVGAACSIKPTAIFMLAPAVGVVLAWRTPVRRWAPAAGIGAVVGVLMLSPWLARNAAAGGNPVFPAASALFGPGDWEPEQHERWSHAHSTDAGVLERARLLVWSDPDAPASAPDVVRQRGLGNPQWGLLVPLAFIGGLIGALNGPGAARRRACAVLLGALALQLLAWGVFTHLQSRLLLPPAATAGVRAGVAFAGTRAGVLWCAALCLVQGGFSLWQFAGERGGAPNGLLDLPPAVYAGRPWLAGTSEQIPSAVVAGGMGADARVYLLGSATPFFYEREVVYNTTYDRWLFGEIVRTHGDDPARWGDALHELGITHVLIDLGELGRLRASGWIDPDVTPERVSALARELGPAMVAFGGGRVVLHELMPPAGSANTTQRGDDP
ncbi:MAG: hypothetical protein AAF995_05790 [Planctomycetota bacterium]